MKYNKLQLLRNKQIKVSRENQDGYLYIQGPTIEELYDDDLLFFTVQILTLEKDELMEYLNVKNKDYSRMEIINIVFNDDNRGEDLMERLNQVILNVELEEEFLCHNTVEITEEEMNAISHLLRIIMGQKKYSDYGEEEKTIEEEPGRELSDVEKRMLELEKKIEEKKNKESKKNEEEKGDNDVLEDVMIALTYEFGFTIDYMMGMNYFTLLWYYSYTTKIHAYRINQFAIGSGMMKEINADYFTSLK